MDNPVVWLVIACYLFAPVFVMFLFRKMWGATHQWIGIVIGGLLAATPLAMILVSGVSRTGSWDPCVMWKSAPEICIMKAWPELYVFTAIAFAYGAGAAGAFVMFLQRKQQR